MAEPRNSMIEPMPPPVPTLPMMASTTSFAVVPSGSTPSTVTAIVPGRTWGSVCVASTCSTSLVPMPNASGPERRRGWRCGCRRTRSVMPGRVRPCSGPITWTMPWPGVAHAVECVMPELGAVRREHLELLGRDGVGDRLVDVLGRDVVVRGGHGEVGPADARGRTGAGRRTPAGWRDLVDEVEVDVEQVGLVAAGVDDVAVPHLLAQGLEAACRPWTDSARRG